MKATRGRHSFFLFFFSGCGRRSDNGSELRFYTLISFAIFPMGTEELIWSLLSLVSSWCLLAIGDSTWQHCEFNCTTLETGHFWKESRASQFYESLCEETTWRSAEVRKLIRFRRDIKVPGSVSGDLYTWTATEISHAKFLGSFFDHIIIWSKNNLHIVLPELLVVLYHLFLF